MDPPRFTRAKVFCLTKNEYDLIEDFVVFYGTLFGYDSVVIIDNGSTHPEVHRVYSEYTPLGIRVHTDTGGVMGEENIRTKWMQEYKNTCEYMFPLDTDEFLFLYDQPGRKEVSLPLTRDKIMSALDMAFKHDGIAGVFYGQILHSYFEGNRDGYSALKPVRDITRFYEIVGAQKIIVRASTFVSVTKGNHEALTTECYREISSNIGLLHFHNTGLSRRFERSHQYIQQLHVFDTSFDQIPTYFSKCQENMPKNYGHIFLCMASFLVRWYAAVVWYAKYNVFPAPNGGIVQLADGLVNDPDALQKIYLYAQNTKFEATDGEVVQLHDVLFGNPRVCDPGVDTGSLVVVSQVKEYLQNIFSK
jgi:hypothetical protein